MSTVTLAILKQRLEEAIGDEEGAYAGKYTKAINMAAREVWPDLFRPLRDQTLITGNLLPNGHFEDWDSTSYPDFYRVSVVTAAEETTIIRGGVSSMKVTRAGTDGYAYISQAEWIKLLDLMDATVDFKCWTLASTASQAYIEIYTKQADGTAQTETSSAHSGGGEFELLEIEDFELNDDLTDIQFRYKVITADGDVYFDDSRVMGRASRELVLPTELRENSIRKVLKQTSGYSDDICDDLQLQAALEPVHGWSIQEDVNYKYLLLPQATSTPRRLTLVGDQPLEDTLDADTETMTLPDKNIPLLIAKAAESLYQMYRGVVSSDDRKFYEDERIRWRIEYLLKRNSLRMARGPFKLRS